MRLRVFVQNLGMGALTSGDGAPQDRWPAIVERARGASTEPIDVYLLQEAAGWELHGHAQVARAMRDLDVDAVPLPRSHSGIRPALLYRRETMGRWVRWNDDFWHRTCHGGGVAVFDLGLPKPVSFVSAHLDPHSTEAALPEAKLLATRALRYGPYAVYAGDFNFPPARGPAPDYAAMRPFNTAARTVMRPPGDPSPLEPDRRVAWKIEQTGFHDAAWEMYERTGDQGLLAPTGTDDRIDRLYVSRPLAPCVASYQLLDTPAEASDHAGLLVELDLSLAATDHLWEYR